MDEEKSEWMKSKNSFYSSFYTNQALRVDSWNKNGNDKFKLASSQEWVDKHIIRAKLFWKNHVGFHFKRFS